MKKSGRREKESAPVVLPVSWTNRVSWALLGLIQVVCPLFFFTNLTRNPYYTQIALLNMGIALLGMVWAVDAWHRGEVRLPRLSFEVPLAAFLVFALATSITSYFRHPFVRPGIAFESVRIWEFTLVNGVLALYLPGAFLKPLGMESRPISIWSDLFFAGSWGGLWLGFYTMSAHDSTQLIWDTYGFFLWAAAAVYAVLRTRRGDALSFFHLIFVVSVVAALYGLMQYVGRDVIWADPIHPYGGRPVSTFGNPNFLSSHLMMVVPVAGAFAFQSRGNNRTGYALVALICLLGTLCTLTRSSYMGLLAAGVVLTAGLYQGNWKSLRKPAALLAGGLALLVVIVLVFPHSPVSAVQSPLSRFTEILDAVHSKKAYGPWDQRILIWSSAWEMVRTNPWMGKGWGCFELFFPFFQGRLLLSEWYATWRTHANNAHNVLMEIWSQTGTIGTGLALWLLVGMLAGGWIVVRRRTEGLARAVAAGLLAALAGMVVDNFFGNVSIFFAVPAFLFWWMVGSLFLESRSVNSTARSAQSVGARVLLGIFISFCAAAFGYYVMRWNQEINYFEGFKLAKFGDVPGSIKALERAYHWFPGEVNGNYELGNSYARHAKTLADKGLPDEARAYNEKAIEAYQAAMKANPGYDELYFNLGVSLNQLGRTPEAIRNIEIALFINPVLKEAYSSLGTIYLSKGQTKDALRIFSEAVQSFPRDKDFWNNLGYTESQLNDPAKNSEESKEAVQKSFEAYKKAVQIDSSFQAGWSNLAAAAKAADLSDPILSVPRWIQDMQKDLEQKRYSEALPIAQQIAAAMPENADAALSLANILFYVGRKDEAEAAYKKALLLNPHFTVAMTNLGKLYQSEQHPDRARAQYDEALSINPNDTEAKSALATLLP